MPYDCLTSTFWLINCFFVCAGPSPPLSERLHRGPGQLLRPVLPVHQGPPESAGEVGVTQLPVLASLLGGGAHRGGEGCSQAPSVLLLVHRQAYCLVHVVSMALR